MIINSSFIRWLNHKLLLSKKSTWYNQPKRKFAIIKVQDVFKNFIRNPLNYNTNKLAILIKQNEGLLETLLPIPNNPSYESAKSTLIWIIEKSETIINQNNLQL